MYDFIITVDGGSLGNGTEDSIGYGSYILDMPKHGIITTPFELKFGVGKTSNEAEYLSLLAALNKVITVIEAPGNVVKDASVKIITDSQLVIGQCSLGWKVKAMNLLPLVREAVALINRFGSVNFEKISGDVMKQILGH